MTGPAQNRPSNRTPPPTQNDPPPTPVPPQPAASKRSGGRSRTVGRPVGQRPPHRTHPTQNSPHTESTPHRTHPTPNPPHPFPCSVPTTASRRGAKLIHGNEKSIRRLSCGGVPPMLSA